MCVVQYHVLTTLPPQAITAFSTYLARRLVLTTWESKTPQHTEAVHVGFPFICPLSVFSTSDAHESKCSA